MKHTKKAISCFMAMSMAMSIVPSSGLLSVRDIVTVDAATVYTENKTGTIDGYDFELWKDRGNTSMTLLGAGSFSCEWSNINNCLFRTGKKLGSTKKYQDYNGINIQYDVDYSPNGNSYMCVYGWTEQPTVEYYIVETWGSWRPPGQAQSLGTVYADGGAYDIYKTMRYDQPSIHGTETFAQYWSVRQQKPAMNGNNIKGNISVSKHFEAWEKAGLEMGKMYEVALNIEGYQSSGKATVNKHILTFGEGVNDSGNTTPSTPEQPEISGTAPSGTGTGISDGFEGTGTSWAARGDSVKLLLTGDMAHGGSKSLAVTGRTASWNGVSVSSSDLKAGGTYSFSSYVAYKNSNYASAGFEFGLQYDLNGETNYDNIGSATAKSGEWALLDGSVEVPAGAENISIYVQSAYSENDTAADLIDFYLDDVKFSGSSSTGSDPGNTPSNPVSSDSLKDKFASCFKMGTSVSPHELSTGGDFIKKHFNSITPENELKPDAIINQQASQQYGNNVNTQISFNSGAKQTMKFCEDNGIAMRGHTFVWYSQTPDWFFRENFSSNGSYVSKDVMDQRLESMIKNTFAAIKEQFPKLKLYSYDVCNELFLNDGGGMRPGSNSGWTKVYGDNNDEFVIKAFEYARKYAPADCKLYLNDYNEYIPAKTDDIYNMAMKLKEKGLIDGIGMQSHLDVSYPSASTYETALKKFISTGLEVQITELDITCGDSSAQAKLFADVFAMAVKNADKIPALTVWGTHDSISWRSSQNPLLFGANYTPKAAYNSVMALDVPTGGSSDTPAVTTAPSQSTPDFTFGDINDDKSIDMSDLSELALYILKETDFNSKQMMAADVEYDKNVDLADLALLKQYVSKKTDKLGVGYVPPVVTTTTTKVTTTQQTTSASQQPAGVTKMDGKVVNGVWQSNCDVSWIDKSKPMVAFTFDDGAVGTSADSTSMRIQNALSKNGFHATFFYVGSWIKNNQAEVVKAYESGFEVGSHTYTHANLSNQSVGTIQNELGQNKNLLNQILGTSNDFLIRPPYLSVDQNFSSNAGAPLINCGVDTQDWNNASKDQIVSKLKSGMQDGSLRNQVVLMHETYQSTAAAMEELLPYMKQQGWQVVSVSELFKANGKELRAGMTYNAAK